MKLIDKPVKMRCPKCNQNVLLKDAFVVVYSCMEKKNGDIVQTPERAFHFNGIEGIRCMGELEIVEN